MISWKVIRDNNVLIEGPIDMVFSYLKKFGDKLNLHVFVKETEIHLISSKFDVQHADLVSAGIREKQLKSFRKSPHFIEGPEHKFCTGCKRSKRKSEFGYRSDSKDGLARRCKECVNKRAKINRKKRNRSPNQAEG